MSNELNTKAKVFALAAAYTLVRDAVAQVTNFNPATDDAVCFNSLVKAIANKKGN